MKLMRAVSIHSLALVCLMFVLFASNVSAFPLTGGNELVNATVFGVITNNNEVGESNNEKEVSFLVDVACDMSQFNAVLVDDDDNFYQAYDVSSPNNMISGAPKQGSANIEGYTQTRTVIEFIVPEGTVIKRLRIEPERNHASTDSVLLPNSYLMPISVDWNGVPEIIDNNTVIKFYGSTHNEDTTSYTKRIIWHNTIKLTNNDSKPLKFRYGDVIFEDQYGWYYPGSGKYYEDEKVTLLPGESMKTVVGVRGVSPLSRLVRLMYQNMSMDISAWT